MAEPIHSFERGGPLSDYLSQIDFDSPPPRSRSRSRSRAHAHPNSQSTPIGSPIFSSTMKHFLNSLFNRFNSLLSNAFNPLLLFFLKLKSSSFNSNPHHLKILPSSASERLKYLICSSFILNPSSPLTPSLEDGLSFSTTSPIDRHSFTPHTWLDSSSLFSYHQHQHHHLHHQSSRLHLKSILSSALVLLIGLYTIPSWTLFSLPFLALLSYSHFRYHSTASSTLPLTSHLDLSSIQASLVPATAQLISRLQDIELQINKAFTAIRQVQCVAIGFSLSDPLPPVSRLENASFLSSLRSPSSLSSPCSPPANLPATTRLHALGLRKVVKSVLDQSQYIFEQASLELESLILRMAHDSPPRSPSSDEMPPSPSSSSSATFQALMDMYGCSRLATPSSGYPRRPSPKQLARRQTWRASLHTRIPHSNSPAPRPSSLQFHTPVKRDPFSPVDSCPRPGSLDTFSGHREASLSGTDIGRLNDDSLLSSSPLSASFKRRSRLSPANTSRQVSLYADALGLVSRQNHRHGSLSYSRHSIAPQSPAHSQSISLSYISPDLRPRSLLLGNTSKRVRPWSMGGITHSPRDCHGSPDFLKVSPPVASSASPKPQDTPIPEEASYVEDSPDDGELLLLKCLQLSYERMVLSRKRVMCCLLALDFESGIDRPELWSDVLSTLEGLFKTNESLGTELLGGIEQEFGSETGKMDEKGSSGTHKVCPPEAVGSGRVGSIDRETASESCVRDFGPPLDQEEARKRRIAELKKHMTSIDLALRTISAKMKVCTEELEVAQGSDWSGKRAVQIHESIRGELETVARQWDQSRNKLRVIVKGPEDTQRRSLDTNFRPLSMNSVEGGLSYGTCSSVLDSEPLTPIDCYNEQGEAEKQLENDNDSEPEQGGKEDWTGTEEKVPNEGSSFEEMKKKVEAIGLESIFQSFAGRDFKRERNHEFKEKCDGNEDKDAYHEANERTSEHLSPFTSAMGRDDDGTVRPRRPVINSRSQQRVSLGSSIQSGPGMVSELRQVLNLMRSKHSEASGEPDQCASSLE